MKESLFRVQVLLITMHKKGEIFKQAKNTTNYNNKNK